MNTSVEHEAASEAPPPLERPGSNGDVSGSAAQLERAALYEASPELQELCRDNGLSASQFAHRGGAAVATLDMFLGFWRSMKSVMHFPVLRELSIVHHPTITALEGLSHCPNLELLCVTECGLERTRGIERCTRLRTLNLSGNRIRRIEGLDTLARLETLWINDNAIERLGGLWKLPQLKQLWAARNRVEHLEAALCGCSNLTDVNLADNRLFSFKSLLSLTSLDQLTSLTLSDPHYGDNPVCRLCNYQTYILCHLSGLTCLDTVELSTRNKQIAEATMLKKKMYYNMRIKAIKRDVRARIKHAESLRSHAEQQTELSVAPLVREKKAIERYIAELAVRSETNDGSEGAGVDCQASQELKNKLACIDACLASKYSAIYRMNIDFTRLWTSLQATHDINIARLLLELETGGNIRLEDGKPSDAWFASCVDLVRSRLFPAELHILGIQDIRINRVTRISNRYLRHRFHARMDELVTVPEQQLKENVSKKGVTVRAKEEALEDQGGEAKRDPASLETHSADASADPTAPDPDATLESSMEYLFYMQPPHLDHQRRSHELEQFAIAESGFREPSEYAQMGLDGAIKLANSVALLDFPRLATALTVKGRLLQGQQPSHQELCRHSTLSHNRQRELTTEMKEAVALAVSGEWDLPSGVLLVVKVFPGYSKSVSPPEETPGSTSQTAGIDARAFPGLQSVQVPCASAALGTTPDATAKQKFYYLFDNTLVLPEYLVEYQYTFADCTTSGLSKSESNKAQSERSIAVRDDVEAPDVGVAIKLADDFERRYRVRRSASPTAGSRCLPQALDDNVAKVLNMEPMLPIVEPLDNAQVVSLRLGAAEVHRVKHLNLMGCGLEHIPDLACVAMQLEVLVLSYNNLQTINDALAGLTKLRTLDLSFNQLERLEHLEHCVGLESLEVNSNLLQTFADVEYLGRTFRQRALRHVDLRKNVLCDTKRYRLHVLRHLPTLECLDQQLVTKDEVLSAQQLVTKLTAANIWDHCCHQRGKAVGTQPPLSSSDHESEFEQSWDAVDDIALTRELISEIEGLERARNLRVAAFADNVIKRISGLETCGKLEELVLEDNEIIKIENLQALVSLKKLHLGRNRISVIEGLDTLENLTQLSLEENQISSLQGLGAALKLMELYVGSNRIEVLKEIQYLKSLPKLTILDLSGNELTRLPDYRLYTIYYLRRVKVLDGVSISPQDQSDAKHKYSGKLTTEFILEKCGSGGSSARSGSSNASGSNPLERIQQMDLAGSRIREIGAISGRVFATLRELNLENNQITDISGLETLPKLRVLNLNRNRIEKLLPSSNSAAFPIPDEVEGKGILACLGLEQLYLAYNQINDMTVLGLQFLDDLKVRQASRTERTWTVHGRSSCDIGIVTDFVRRCLIYKGTRSSSSLAWVAAQSCESYVWTGIAFASWIHCPLLHSATSASSHSRKTG